MIDWLHFGMYVASFSCMGIGVYMMFAYDQFWRPDLFARWTRYGFYGSYPLAIGNVLIPFFEGLEGLGGGLQAQVEMNTLIIVLILCILALSVAWWMFIRALYWLEKYFRPVQGDYRV